MYFYIYVFIYLPDVFGCTKEYFTYTLGASIAGFYTVVKY